MEKKEEEIEKQGVEKESAEQGDEGWNIVGK